MVKNIKIVLLSGFICALSLVLCAKSAAALSYNCNPNHCYGVNVWYPGGSTTYNGASTTELVRGISGGNGLLTNELWLAQDNSIWVEGGYMEAPYDTNGQESWVDAQQTSNGFQMNVGPTVQSGDYGRYAVVTIFKESSSYWRIYVTGNTSGMTTSFYNSMTANHVVVGSELEGTSGASSPLVEFTYNQYVDPVINKWVKFNWNGSFIGHNPPWLAWWQGQKPQYSSTGGDLGVCTLPSPTGHYPCQ